MATVSLSDLEDALLWVNGGSPGEMEAFIEIATGRIFMRSSHVDLSGEMELPEDIDDAERYLEIPSSRDLDLGRAQLIEFVERHLPADADLVRGYFQRSGSFARTKDLLHHRRMLDEWHNYENEMTKAALKEWGTENGFEVTGS